MQLPFVKAHVCGNHFLILDEMNQDVISDEEAVFLAGRMTDPHTGVGADGLIRLQGKGRGTAPFTGIRFRIMEPDGSESLSCGNGLLCASLYLFAQYGMKNPTFLTQIPSGNPVPVPTGSDGDAYWIRMPPPRLMPPFLFQPETYPEIGKADQTLQFSIRERRETGGVCREMETITLTGKAVFSGEPHLVVDGGRMDPPLLRDRLFSGQGPACDLRHAVGDRLMEHIGVQLVCQYPGLFPKGVNVTVMLREKNQIRYRCFERGVMRETLSCGTGALACAAVSCWGDPPEEETEIFVVPELFSRRYFLSGYRIVKQSGGWYLFGKPEILFRGFWRGKERRG